MIPKYSLELYKLLLDQRPLGASEMLFAEGAKEYAKLEEEAQTPEQVEFSMVNFGKKVWPYIRAEELFIEKYGQEKQKEFFLANLGLELAEKWRKFEAEGGGLHDFRNAEKYENYFTGEEDAKIGEAQLESKSKVKEFLDEMIKGEKKEEYEAMVEMFKKERDEILEKIEILRSLKNKTKKWANELDEEVYFFERGFAELEERPTVEKVQGKIDWYKDEIETGG